MRARHLLIVPAVSSLLLSGVVAPPANADPAVTANAVTPVANPVIPESCGLDATLVLDASGSIQQQSAVDKVRTAGKAFLGALKDTKSTARITQFGTFSDQLATRTVVDDAATSASGVLTKAMNKYYNPIPPKPGDSTIYQYRGGNWTSPDNYFKDTASNANQWTNWDAGMGQARTEAKAPEIIVFVTDGDPTAFNLDRTKDPHYGNGKNVAVNTGSGSAADPTLDRAIDQANAAKGANTRIMVVGVGPAVTKPGSDSVKRMEKISGPQVVQDKDLSKITNINQIDVALVKDFDNLASFLRQVVSELCTPSLTIRKLAQTADTGGYVPFEGWDMTVKPTVSGGFDWVLPDTTPSSQKTEATDADGYAAFQWEPKVHSTTSDALVSEQTLAGYTPGRPGTDNDWVCEKRTPDDASVEIIKGDFADPSDPKFNISVGPREIVTCSLYNSFQYAPGIELTKSVVDAVDVAGKPTVRGNANGWDLKYRFVVKNTGNSSLSGVNVADGRCDAQPTRTQGSGDRLPPGQSWTFECPKRVQVPSSTNPDLNLVNTANASGSAPNGTVVNDDDSATVWIKTPAMTVTKTPSATKIPAGGSVTYTYQVTNTGNDPIKDVEPSDTKCSPLSGPTGDGGTSGVLDVGETWTYTCSTKLYEPTRNVVTVDGKWSQATPGGQNNGPVTATDDAIVDVVIPAYITVVKSAVPEDGTGFAYTATGTGLNPDDAAFTLAPGAPGGKRSKTLVVEPAASGTQYTITEAGSTGWSLKGIQCVGAQSEAVDPDNGQALVTVKPGQTATCTYRNERLGSLTIRKVVQPSSSDKTFSFTATGVTPTDFSLGNEQEQEFDAIPAGTAVTVAETVPADWQLASITCDGGSAVVSGNGITWTAENATDVVCTFVNRAVPKAQLTVVKVADPVEGDFAYTASGRGVTDPAFTLSPRGTDPAPSTTQTVSPVPAGSDYTITETPQDQWTLNEVKCRVSGPDGVQSAPVVGNPATGAVQVTLKPGESGTCTYRNERKSTLTIIKNVSVPVTDPGAKATPFDFTATGVTPDSFRLKDFDDFGDKQTYTSIPAGTDVTVTETLPSPDWSLSGLQCSAPWSVNGLELSITMGAGEDVTCAFSNAKAEPPTAMLEVVKLADPADGTDFGFRVQGAGPVPVDETFDLNPPNTTSQTLELSPQMGGTEYTVTESAVDGWDQQLDCAIEGIRDGVVVGPVATLTLEPGDSAVCTAVNVKRGSLTVVKQTDPPDSPRQFDFTATGKPDFTLTDGQTRTFDNLAAGTNITVAEGADQLWRLDEIMCSDGSTPNLAQRSVEVTVEAGEDVVCTFVNAELPPAFIATVKFADPEEGAFPFTLTGGVTDEEFTLTPPDDVAEVFAVRPPLAGVEYTLTEGPIPNGWDLEGTYCILFDIDGVQTETSGTDASVSQLVKPGEFWVCGFENLKRAQFTVAKVAEDARGQLFDFAWDQQPGTFQLGNGDSRKAAALPAGASVQVTETKPPFWTLDSITCDGPATTVDDIDVGTGMAKVTLGAGGDGTCTYVNTRTIYNPKMVLSKTADPIEVLPNGEVTYTYVLENVGDVALEPKGAKDEIITDNKCSPVAHTDGAGATLEPGQSWTFECTKKLAEDTENTATATMVLASDPSKDLKVTAVAFVPVLVPDIKIVKSADRRVVYNGDEVNYAYSVTNPGQVPLADVSVTDDVCGPVTGPDPGWDTNDNDLLDPLVEEQTWHCTDTLTATTTNTGTATGIPTLPNQPAGPTVNDTGQVEVRVLNPDLSISKTPSARGGTWNGDIYQVASNTPVTFTYEVVNTGDAPLGLGAGVTDDKCAPVRYVSGDDGSGLIQPGQTWVYRCVNTPVGNTLVTNVATVTGVEPEVGGRFERSDDATVESFESGIAIKKSANKQVVEPGTPVTYTYSVINTGSTVLSDVRVTDDKCAPANYGSGDTNADGELGFDETWVFNCTTALASDTVNVAEAFGTDPGGNEVTDAAAARVLVIGGELNPAIAVKKSPSATRVTRGATVVYTYEVTNVGTMPLADIRTSDDKCAPVSYVSGDDNGDGLLTAVTNGEGYPDEKWVFTCSAAIAKNTTNTVVAKGAPWDAGQVVGTDVSAQAQATVTVSVPKLPIKVKTVKKKKYPSGKYTTLVKRAKTDPQGKLRYRTLCRPVKAKAAGDVSFCRVKVSKKGRVKVKIMGYRKVRVTVWITAIPKPKYADRWRGNRWKNTWVLRSRR